MATYKIKVDHSDCEAAAKEINQYLFFMDRRMNIVRQTAFIAELASWQGADKEAFMQKWIEAQGKDSTYEKVRETLSAYAKFLKYAAAQYKEAQSDAVNRANKLK